MAKSMQYFPEGSDYSCGMGIDAVDWHTAPCSKVIVTLYWKSERWTCWESHSDNDINIVPLFWFTEQQRLHPDLTMQKCYELIPTDEKK